MYVCEICDEHYGDPKAKLECERRCAADDAANRRILRHRENRHGMGRKHQETTPTP